MNATFPKSERLCSKIGIDALFANGEARRSGGFTVKFLRDHTKEKVTDISRTSRASVTSMSDVSMDAEALEASSLAFPKVLISVPKRFQKHAVDRNRTKRLIREIYRKYRFEHLSESNIHSLAIIYASTKVPDYSFVEEHLPKLLEKIK
jgi:ribonuclease P protein component